MKNGNGNNMKSMIDNKNNSKYNEEVKQTTRKGLKSIKKVIICLVNGSSILER